MTLFLNVARDFLIKNIKDLIEDSNSADARSTQLGPLAGERTLPLSAKKRDILTDLIKALDALQTTQDDQNKTSLITCIETSEQALSDERKKTHHAPASTEESLLNLKAFISDFFQKLETLQLLDKTQPQKPKPIFHYYHAMAFYFAKRLSENANKTNLMRNTVRWFSAQPMLSSKLTFLTALDNIVEQNIKYIQNNLAGQNKQDESFPRRVAELVNRELDSMRREHEELRHHTDHRTLGQALSITFLLDYLNEAKQAIACQALDLDSLIEPNTHGAI